jgi:hypothetical protein
MQTFNRAEHKNQEEDEFDRVEGRAFEDQHMQQPMTERHEHEHAETIIAKKFLSQDNSVMRYRSESWFMPLVGIAGFLGLLLLAAIIL